MARRRKQSLLSKFFILGIVGLAIFGGYRLGQESGQILIEQINKVESFASETYVTLTNYWKEKGNV